MAGTCPSRWRYCSARQSSWLAPRDCDALRIMEMDGSGRARRACASGPFNARPRSCRPTELSNLAKLGSAVGSAQAAAEVEERQQVSRCAYGGDGAAALQVVGSSLRGGDIASSRASPSRRSRVKRSCAVTWECASALSSGPPLPPTAAGEVASTRSAAGGASWYAPIRRCFRDGSGSDGGIGRGKNGAISRFSTRLRKRYCRHLADAAQRREHCTLQKRPLANSPLCSTPQNSQLRGCGRVIVGNGASRSRQYGGCHGRFGGRTGGIVPYGVFGRGSALTDPSPASGRAEAPVQALAIRPLRNAPPCTRRTLGSACFGGHRESIASRRLSAPSIDNEDVQVAPTGLESQLGEARC